MNSIDAITQNSLRNTHYSMFIPSYRMTTLATPNVHIFNDQNEISMLLPNILKEASQEIKFITLIGSPRKLDKNWFCEHKLSLAHFIQLNTGKPSIHSMRLVLRALSSGESSTVITWLNETSQEQLQQLNQAAIYGNSKAIILPLQQYH